MLGQDQPSPGGDEEIAMRRQRQRGGFGHGKDQRSGLLANESGDASRNASTAPFAEMGNETCPRRRATSLPSTKKPIRQRRQCDPRAPAI